nr:precorrin-8X methylmutase [Veillonella rogosae]
MDYVKNPKEIEDKSMQIIYDYVKDLGLTDDEVRVVSRTVHASGDVEYAQLVKMSLMLFKKVLKHWKTVLTFTLT